MCGRVVVVGVLAVVVLLVSPIVVLASLTSYCLAPEAGLFDVSARHIIVVHLTVRKWSSETVTRKQGSTHARTQTHARSLSLSLSLSLSPPPPIPLSRLSVSVILCPYLSTCLSLPLSVCLSARLSVCLSVCLSLSLGKEERED